MASTIKILTLAGCMALFIPMKKCQKNEQQVEIVPDNIKEQVNMKTEVYISSNIYYPVNTEIFC